MRAWFLWVMLICGGREGRGGEIYHNTDQEDVQYDANHLDRPGKYCNLSVVKIEHDLYVVVKV